MNQAKKRTTKTATKSNSVVKTIQRKPKTRPKKSSRTTKAMKMSDHVTSFLKLPLLAMSIYACMCVCPPLRTFM